VHDQRYALFEWLLPVPEMSSPKRSASDPPPAISVDDTLPFRFIAGDLSLDFVNTVDWTSRGPARDRLGSYGRVVEWALAAEILDDRSVSRLERRAFMRQRDAAVALETARALRWTLRRLVSAIAENDRAVASVRLPLDELNAFAGDVFAHMRLALPSVGRGARSSPLTWTWADDADRLDSPLWPIVRSAAGLLTSSDAERLRVCAGCDCGWVYVDRSRNGLRRWCEMSTCGTAEKSRRRRARSA
jgi:predicted RNA-binding Zn ribbon-like protein